MCIQKFYWVVTTGSMPAGQRREAEFVRGKNCAILQVQKGINLPSGVSAGGMGLRSCPKLRSQVLAFIPLIDQ